MITAPGRSRALRSRRAASIFTVLLLSAISLSSAARLPAQSAQESFPAAWRSVLDGFAQRIAADVATDTIGGITAGVVIGDRIVWARGFGYADRDRKIAANENTIYRIGSISKSFTAVALMQAAQRGVLKLEDPVEKYLPTTARFADPRPGAAPPTLRQLASHTAGLIREPALDGAATGPITHWEDKVIASIPRTRFDTVPGARYAYSNIGFGVLGLAVSRASATPFIELVEDKIFKPLGMSSSTFIITDRLKSNLSVGYQNGRTGINTDGPAREHDGRGYKVPNGGIYSTVGDLAKFIGAMNGALGDRLLNASDRAAMLRIQTPGSTTQGYGLGFSINQSSNGRRIIGHGGSVAGYTAHLVFDPDARVGVVLLRNYGSGRTALARASADLLRDLLAAAVPR
ncbi:MAG: serine hydrolase domain-containing protein [Gemmatimonadota bacterium]